MKSSSLVLIFLLFALGNIAEAQLPENTKLPEYKLLNQPMPEFTGQTLSGKKIDKAYFKGKVTLVNFMFIGCRACMIEIGSLNQLYSDNKANPKFQVLGISANTVDQLNHFNAEDTTTYSRVRRALKTDAVAYDLMAECASEKSKPANVLGAECATISEKFLFNGYPNSFLIDKKGKIRKIISGFPTGQNNGFALDANGKMLLQMPEKVNQEFVKEWQTEIDKLLKE